MISVVLLVGGGASAQTLTASKTQDMEYARSFQQTRGASLEITVDVSKNSTDTVYAFGIIESLPEGWVYEGLVHNTSPGVFIAPETGAAGMLEFAWIEPPAFPVKLTYSVITNGLGGTVLGQGLYRYDDAEQKTLVRLSSVTSAGRALNSLTQNMALSLSPLSPGGGSRSVSDCQVHSADYQGQDYIINLSELLRVIQFYNSNGFHCQTGTEDRYAPGPGGQSCDTHDSDWSSPGPDWTIDLSEVLRISQFYNSDGYRYDHSQTTKDGFKPGTGEIPANADTISNTEIDLTCGVLPYLGTDAGHDVFTLYVVNNRATTCSDERTVNMNRNGMTVISPDYNHDIDLFADYEYVTYIPESDSPQNTIGQWTTWCPTFVNDQYETIEYTNPDDHTEDGDLSVKIECSQGPDVSVEVHTLLPIKKFLCMSPRNNSSWALSLFTNI